MYPSLRSASLETLFSKFSKNWFNERPNVLSYVDSPFDVYADFKFKRPMMILLFPCEEKDLETRYEALVRDLQAEGSYNKWDVLARSDEAR